MKTYREKDLRTNTLETARVAILGYGNQGHAHAMNLRDSGVDVVVGARERGDGWRLAADHRFEPVPIAEAVRASDYAVRAEQRTAARSRAGVGRPRQLEG